jgi:hypothetical protein
MPQAWHKGRTGRGWERPSPHLQVLLYIIQPTSVVGIKHKHDGVCALNAVSGQGTDEAIAVPNVPGLQRRAAVPASASAADKVSVVPVTCSIAVTFEAYSRDSTANPMVGTEVSISALFRILYSRVVFPAASRPTICGTKRGNIILTWIHAVAKRKHKKSWVLVRAGRSDLPRRSPTTMRAPLGNRPLLCEDVVPMPAREKGLVFVCLGCVWKCNTNAQHVAAFSGSADLGKTGEAKPRYYSPVLMLLMMMMQCCRGIVCCRGTVCPLWHPRWWLRGRPWMQAACLIC